MAIFMIDEREYFENDLTNKVELSDRIIEIREMESKLLSELNEEIKKLRKKYTSKILSQAEVIRNKYKKR